MFNTQLYKVQIKGKVKQSKEKELHPPQPFGVVAIKKRAFETSSTIVANLHFYLVSYKLLIIVNCTNLLRLFNI